MHYLHCWYKTKQCLWSTLSTGYLTFQPLISFHSFVIGLSFLKLCQVCSLFLEAFSTCSRAIFNMKLSMMSLPIHHLFLHCFLFRPSSSSSPSPIPFFVVTSSVVYPQHLSTNIQTSLLCQRIMDKPITRLFERTVSFQFQAVQILLQCLKLVSHHRLQML